MDFAEGIDTLVGNNVITAQRHPVMFEFEWLVNAALLTLTEFNRAVTSNDLC